MTRVQATVVCDIIMLYALEERNVYKKSIIDDELKSANIAIAKTAFALIDRAVRNSCTYPLLTYLLTYFHAATVIQIQIQIQIRTCRARLTLSRGANKMSKKQYEIDET